MFVNVNRKALDYLKKKCIQKRCVVVFDAEYLPITSIPFSTIE